MSEIIINERTCKDPITLIGEMAGICYGAKVDDPDRNYKRGLDCLESGHGRTWEFPDVYLTFSGYSAKLGRELYTHIGGSPTRLQSSTRYIDYGENGFDFVEPPSIAKDKEAHVLFLKTIRLLKENIKELRDIGVSKEDASALLPLALETTISAKYNMRTLIDMSHQRMCSRAYWEYRKLMNDLCKALSEYSDQWAYIVENYFKPKCEITGFCTEKFSCNRKPKKEKL